MRPDWGPQYTHLLRTRAYLLALPQGLDSYPGCQTKGAVWRNIAAGTDIDQLVEKVPIHLGVLPDPNILGSSWYSAVQHFAAHLAMRDCLFATDDAIYEHFYKLNTRLLSGPLYKVMFALASPQLVAHASDRRFATLFKGVTLRTTTTGPTQCRVELRYPEKILPRLVARLYMTAFVAALELARARGVAGRMVEYSDTLATYELAWR